MRRLSGLSRPLTAVRSALLGAALVVGLVPPGVPPSFAQLTDEQSGCVVGSATDEVDAGTPSAEGMTRQVQFAAASDKAAFNFTIPSAPEVKALAASVYVGDQWYDLDLALYRHGACKALYQWQVKAAAVSERADRRVLQFVRPDEQLLQNLEPGQYRLVVAHKYFFAPALASDFSPQHGFTVRIAVTPNICGLTPPNDQPHPAMFDPNLDEETRARYADVRQRPDSALYQLGMTVQPESPGPFSLMSFNAIISPPYTDLFDFAWSLDGAPLPNADGPIAQLPASHLAKTPDGIHTVSVTARGAREYQDPTDPRYNNLPLEGGTLTVTCQFTSSE
ncbi:MAG: hypothetical protein IT305_30640 [Chloroflexi bacterium]|nr:hypothetical protein [Chloroflexota bacterium]